MNREITLNFTDLLKSSNRMNYKAGSNFMFEALNTHKETWHLIPLHDIQKYVNILYILVLGIVMFCVVT